MHIDQKTAQKFLDFMRSGLPIFAYMAEKTPWKWDDVAIENVARATDSADRLNRRDDQFAMFLDHLLHCLTGTEHEVDAKFAEVNRKLGITQ